MKIQIVLCLVSAVLAAAAVHYPYTHRKPARLQAVEEEGSGSSSKNGSDGSPGFNVQNVFSEFITMTDGDMHSMMIEPLQTGQAIEIVYISPDKGRVTVNLDDSDNVVPLTIDTRYEWNDWKESLNLNSKGRSGWLTEERPAGFPFPYGEVATTIVLRIECTDDTFDIFVNGIEIHKYKYRGELLPSIVKRIYFRVEGSEGVVITRPAELVSMTLLY